MRIRPFYALFFGIFNAYLVAFSLYLVITKRKIQRRIDRRRKKNIINFDKSANNFVLLLLKVIGVTTEHQNFPKIGQNSILSSFFPEGQKKARPKAKDK